MIKEHDRVVLKESIPAQGLKTRDVGTVIHIYKKGEAFEVEFLTLHGETVAITTLEASQVRPVQKRNHSRPSVTGIAKSSKEVVGLTIIGVGRRLEQHLKRGT